MNNESTAAPEEEAPPLLSAPRTPLPDLVQSRAGLDEAISALQQGHGDIALDAERASGYRYSQRAYLIQIFRRGGGLHLIDPAAFDWGEISTTFAPLNEVIQEADVVIHASSQDLPCLREVGLHPTKIFDTEVAARIAGFPRVGLGALTESLLQLRLAKEHSAVDWSIRPLHYDWLIYAALDVDVLLDVKDEIVRVLTEKNKLEWAIQESQACLDMPPTSPRKDPWRRTSGIHQIKRPDLLAMVRELWIERDAIARERDIAPGRLLNDRALVAAVLKNPATIVQLKELPAFKKDSPRWWNALERARAHPTVAKSPASDGPPTQLRIWREKAPLAYARLTHARAQLNVVAAAHELPVENLLTPEIVRRFCWVDPPEAGRAERDIEQWLRQTGARPWQIALTAATLKAIEGEKTPLEIPHEADASGSEVTDLS